ncbi:MAG: ABC transporter ATP-binding protein [Anaerolineae bacterium]|uniref:ABC transporter ATP-binding protein n=1 Tax=Promineifilum sp. TaxID=2664178 RepID=UPI001E0656EF|nr:ABC transporter ATP-binding protein [Anaerolineales bacterium]MCB8935313.1 ABC transporter ATP-binding protein [Promineifilum sp.]MCO5180375.1 ABC transporter ATP-binding protein [Promineifilum sp.]MCW5846581.1 ABC transporter ATP-binding protein [Anaerolineae bacterium]
MTQVTLHNLSKTYDRHHPAVVDVCLDIPCGRITALLGPSGCGKTTLLKMIAGLLPPSGGDVCFDGQSVLHVPAERRGAVMVFQNHLLFPTLSVFDNVAFGLKMRGEPRTVIGDRVAAMLDLVKLSGYEGRRPHQLSGGQRQRVALARALVIEPKVLLLDEPLSNLDAHLRIEMRDLIYGLQRQLGITTVVVTHDQEEAVILADQIALIFDGALHQAGAPGDFYERPNTQAIARFFGGANFIPGHKSGAYVDTTLGPFRHRGSRLPDGPVLATIRPENIRLVADGEADNTVGGTVVSRVYAGTHTRLRLQAGIPQSLPLEVITEVGDRPRHQEGDSVQLQLPAQKIWLLPDDR